VRSPPFVFRPARGPPLLNLPKDCKIMKKPRRQRLQYVSRAEAVGSAWPTAKRFANMEGAPLSSITGATTKGKRAEGGPPRFIKKKTLRTVVGDVSWSRLGRSGPGSIAVVKEETMGHIDILFREPRAAGDKSHPPRGKLLEAHFDQTFDVNVKGMCFTGAEALPPLQRPAVRFVPELFWVSNVARAFPGFTCLRRE